MDEQRRKTGQRKYLTQGVLGFSKHNQQRRENSAQHHGAQNGLKNQLYDTKLKLEKVEEELKALPKGSKMKRQRTTLEDKKKSLNTQMKQIRVLSGHSLRIVPSELNSRRQAMAAKENDEPSSPISATSSDTTDEAAASVEATDDHDEYSMEVSDPYASPDDRDTTMELDGPMPPAPAGDNDPPALPIPRDQSAPSGPSSTPSDPNSTPSGPNSTPSGPNSAPVDPDSSLKRKQTEDSNEETGICLPTKKRGRQTKVGFQPTPQATVNPEVSDALAENPNVTTGPAKMLTVGTRRKKAPAREPVVLGPPKPKKK
jgi:hypothetical protein